MKGKALGQDLILAYRQLVSRVLYDEVGHYTLAATLASPLGVQGEKSPFEDFSEVSLQWQPPPSLAGCLEVLARAACDEEKQVAIELEQLQKTEVTESEDWDEDVIILGRVFTDYLGQTLEEAPAEARRFWSLCDLKDLLEELQGRATHAVEQANNGSLVDSQLCRLIAQGFVVTLEFVAFSVRHGEVMKGRKQRAESRERSAEWDRRVKTLEAEGCPTKWMTVAREDARRSGEVWDEKRIRNHRDVIRKSVERYRKTKS